MSVAGIYDIFESEGVTACVSYKSAVKPSAKLAVANKITVEHTNCTLNYAAYTFGANTRTSHYPPKNGEKVGIYGADMPFCL